MTTPIKQLKDENGNEFYPQTAKDAVWGLIPLQTSDLDDESVTGDKIDFSTIDEYPEKCTDVDSALGSSIVFELDVSTTDPLFYDINIFAHSPSATSNGGFALNTSNTKQGQAWTRRIGYENGGFSDENSIPQSESGLCYFTRNNTGGTVSLDAFITGTIFVDATTSSNRVRGSFILHATGVSSSVLSTFEAAITPVNGKITFNFIRSNGQIRGYARAYKKK